MAKSGTGSKLFYNYSPTITKQMKPLLILAIAALSYLLLSHECNHSECCKDVTERLKQANSDIKLANEIIGSENKLISPDSTLVYW